MEICDVVIPDEVRYFWVEYVFENWSGRIENWRRYPVSQAELAIAKYCDGIVYIGSSEDYERVGLYYALSDGVKHLIKSYSTTNGYVCGGEQV